MDKINAGSYSVNKTSQRQSKSVKGRTADKAAKETELSEPVDSLAVSQSDTTRQERIKIAMDKAAMGAAKYAAIMTSALIGHAIGGAVGFSIAPGPLAIGVGGAVGALGGYFLHQTKIDTKIGNAINKGVGYALAPAFIAGKAVKNAAKKAVKALKPSSRSDKNVKASQVSSRSPSEDNTDNNAAVSPKSNKTGNKADLERVENTGVSAEGNNSDIKDPTLLDASIYTGKAVPKFIYPSIRNADPAEFKAIIETLDSLPLRAVTSTDSITMSSTLIEQGAAGRAWDVNFGSPIELDKGQFAIKDFGRGTLIHELGHTVDFSANPLPRVGYSSASPWGKGPYVVDPWLDWGDHPPYSSTNRFEDFAQSYKFYHESPDKLKEVSLEKFEAMEKIHAPTLYDKVMDRSGIRELGKKTAQLIDKVPHLRTALNVLASIASPLELHRGSDKLEEGIKNADITKKYEGKMHLAQGLSFAQKVTAPLGLGIMLSRIAFNRKIKKGKWSVEKADQLASKVLAAMAGPIGMTCLAASNELLKPDSETSMKAQSSKGFKYDKVKPNKAFVLRDEINVTRSDENEKIKSEDTKLTRDDKKFVAKVAGGAVTGGAAGTAAGWIGGGAAGAVLGGLVGGPFGAALGGFLGKAAGTMFLSYQGAKIGAKAGRLLDKSPKSQQNSPSHKEAGSSLKADNSDSIESSSLGKVSANYDLSSAKSVSGYPFSKDLKKLQTS